jgi:hypothetical protein
MAGKDLALGAAKSENLFQSKKTVSYQVEV